MDHTHPNISDTVVTSKPSVIERIGDWLADRLPVSTRRKVGAAVFAASMGLTGCATDGVDAVPRQEVPVPGTLTPGAETPSSTTRSGGIVDKYADSVVDAKEGKTNSAEPTKTSTIAASESAEPSTGETVKPSNEEEAIREALVFADAPLAERQAEFLRVSQLALDTTTDNSNYARCFSESVGANGSVLAAYNPLFRPGTEVDSAVDVLGQKYFADQLADSMGLEKNPNILDKQAALRVLAGAYYEPLLSKDYIREAGLSEKQDYGTLNEEEVTIQSGISGITDIEFDDTAASKIAPIVDSEGVPYPVRVVKHTTDKTAEGITIYDVVILVNGQWLTFEGTITADKLSSTLTQLNSAYNQN